MLGPYLTECPPDNNICTSATVLNCGDIDIAGTTTNASDDNPTTCGGAGDGSAGGVWYTFMGTGSQMVVTLNADPGNADDLGDSQLAIYSGDCAALACDFGNDDHTPPGGNGSQVSFTSVAGTTYYAYADGWSTNSGDFLISLSCCGSTSVALAGAGTTVATASCDDGAWTYYEDPAAPGSYIFAIEWDAAGTGSNAAATVSVTLDPAIGAADDVAGSGNGTWTMKRYWDVSGATLVDPVNVKFFYDAAEKTEVETAQSNAGGIAEGFIWFKTVGAAFSPAAITPIGVVQDAIELTDVSGGAMENGVLYAQFEGIASFSGGTGATGSGGGTPLPVELLSFNAKAMETENMITWQTASEENTEWHILERSVNGQSDWQEISRAEAAGTSSDIISYETMDKTPLAVSYYRLRSVDYDTYEEISAVVHVERVRIDGDISVYPNPTKGTANVDFELAQSETVMITVADITGNVISYESVAAQRGSNNHQIEMASLYNGIYFISMETSLGKTTQRIVKN